MLRMRSDTFWTTIHATVSAPSSLPQPNSQPPQAPTSGPASIFPAASAGMETNLYRREAWSFALKRDAIKARRVPSLAVVGSKSSWSFRNWTLSNATLSARSDGAAVVAEQTPTERGPKMRPAASPPEARRRASKLSRRQRRRPRPAPDAMPDAALASESFTVSSLSGRLWSPIAEAYGCP